MASVAAIAVLATVLVVAQNASALMQPQPARPPAGTIAAGADHSCAIRVDGTIVCWGSNSYGQTDAPGGAFTAVSAGTYHSCAIRTDSTVVCWGDNPYGQIDAPGGTFAGVAAGQGYSCGIRTDGTALCWGAQTWGLLDAPGGAFRDVAAGRLYSCGIRPDHTLTCWGNSGWLSDVPDGTFVDVALGWDHSCGVRTDGTISCWGVNFGGQRDAPNGTFIDVGVGANYACAVTTGGTVKCWGDNSYGRAEAPSGTFAAVAAGEFHACGLRTDNTISCWGWNEHGLADAPGGQLGPPTQHTPQSTATGDTTAGTASSGPGAEPPLPGDSGQERKITNDTVTDWDGISVFHIFETPIDDPEAADTTTRPVTGSVPGAVRDLAATPQRGGGVALRWSPPADDGGSPVVRYEIEYSRKALYYHRDHGSRDPWHISKTVRGTSHIYGRLLSGVAYTVKVRAINSAGAGRITTAGFETLAPPGAPRGVQATPLHDGGVALSWSAPTGDGGSPITHYEVQYSRPALRDHPDHANRGPWRISKTVRGASHIYRRLLPDVTYTVTVRAVNSVGAGPSTTGRVFATRQPCPTGDKFKVDRTGFLWRHKRVVALRDFTTINNIEVEAGTRGGKVSSESSLSQSGCSWIFNDAEVSDDAVVSENAVVHGDARVYDDAQVYGNAEVYGNARVYGDAQVYGDANVSGRAQVYDYAEVYDNAAVYDRAKVYDNARVYERAQVFGEAQVFLWSATTTFYDVDRFEHPGGRVYGDAKVYDEAKVYGYAKLFGSAEFSGTLEASDHEFDGEQEHVRAGRELYRELYAHIAAELKACNPKVGSYSENQIPEIVRNLLSDNLVMRLESKRHVDNCKQHELTSAAFRILFVPTLTWWDIVFAFALSITAFRGSFYLKSLIELAQEAKSLSDLSKLDDDVKKLDDDVKKWEVDATRMFDEFKKCEDSWNSAEPCVP